MSEIRWWVDIANAPHVALFRPVVRELRSRGDYVFVTAWDRGQTRDLATKAWPDVALAGAPGFKTPIFAKGTAIFSRARELSRRVKQELPLTALGHNSYSQLLAAKMLGLGSITMMDYEHQPANHLAFRLADIILIPEVIPASALRPYALHRGVVLRYPGTKEEVALADFTPDPTFRSGLAIDEQAILAVVRPAAEGALYHRHKNTLSELAIQRLVTTGAIVLLSPRTESQARTYAKPGVRILHRPVSGANMLYHADLMIGAGGTMTRESAILGTPTFSIFEGKPSAVDLSLAQAGRMTIITSRRELPTAERQSRLPPWSGRTTALTTLVDTISTAHTCWHRRRVRHF